MPAQTTAIAENASEAHDRSVTGFCRSLGISRPTFYRLEGEQRPRTVKVRGRTIVAETTQEYLHRLTKDAA